MKKAPFHNEAWNPKHLTPNQIFPKTFMSFCSIVESAAIAENLDCLDNLLALLNPLHDGEMEVDDDRAVEQVTKTVIGCQRVGQLIIGIDQNFVEGLMKGQKSTSKKCEISPLVSTFCRKPPP